MFFLTYTYLRLASLDEEYGLNILSTYVPFIKDSITIEVILAEVLFFITFMTFVNLSSRFKPHWNRHIIVEIILFIYSVIMVVPIVGSIVNSTFLYYVVFDFIPVHRFFRPVHFQFGPVKLRIIKKQV